MKKMDLQHTGYRELVYIETDCITFTIKGDPSYPDTPGIEFTDKDSLLKVTCNDTVNEYRIKGEKFLSDKSIAKISPMFFEQKQYELVIEGSDNNRISFWHNSKLIRDRISFVGRYNNILTGVINFRNEIGLSDFTILVDDKEYLTITIEVFPSKISYRDDYKEIVEDVTKEMYNLVFDFLKKTYHGYRQSGNRESSLTEYFSIISEIYGRFIKSVDKIIEQPYHLLESYNRILPANKIKKADNRTIKWIQKHPENVVKSGNNVIVGRAMAVKKHVTFDNRENRLVKYMLQETLKQLELLKKNYIALQRVTDPEVVYNIDSMINNIKRRIYNSFLRNVDANTENTGMSLVFSMAPGYRELYKYYVILQRGLDITGDVFNISVKDLAVLYEYWCFIKLNSILKEKYDLISQDIIRVEGNRLIVSLVKGQNSKVRYINANNGEKITLSYNPKSKSLPTVSQKPDNVLSLEKSSLDNDKPIYEYVFDAKYKIDPALKGSHYYNNISNTPGPKEEDINTMHRYRDAIVSEQGIDNFERTMFGAYVLFPYSDEEKYKAHKFYKSIEKVNIGGLPFLPSSTTLVEELLDDLVSDSPETAFERTTLPVGIERKLKKVNWEKRDVLVGTVNDTYEFNRCKKEMEYCVPAKYVDYENLPIHYIALYQPKKNFGYKSGIYVYGEVLSTRVAEHIEEGKFYHFKVRAWEQLQRSIDVKEYAEKYMFTNMFLLKHSVNMSQLRIKNEEEYRLYYEIDRLVNDECINEDNKSISINIDDYIIQYDNGDILFKKNNDVLLAYEAKVFNKRPGYYLKKVKQRLDKIESES